jgi:hypothetical protein
MKSLLTASFLLLVGPAVWAGAPVVDTQPAAIAGYTPKTKSVFTSTADQHNPFWPIGWVKTVNDSVDTSSAPVVPHTDDFLVTTILLNDPPMAVINGKDMAEGEVATLQTAAGSVVVQLMAVQDGSVTLRWENQNLVVPIHRDDPLLGQAGQ